MLRMSSKAGVHPMPIINSTSSTSSILARIALIAFTTVVMLLMPLATAWALDLDVRSSRSSRLDFSLHIDHSSMDLDNGSSVVELNQERIGIVSVEVPFSGPQLGLLLGYAYADFTSTNSYESIPMDGYYIGVSALANLFRYGNFSLPVSAQYVYQSIDGKDQLERASLSWDEMSVSALLQLRIENTGQLFAGVRTTSIDGRYRYNGATNVSTEIENDNRQAVLVGFDYFIDRLESVGILVQRGTADGITLRFRKLY